MMNPTTAEERISTWRDLQWATALIMKRFRVDLANQGLTIEEFDVLIHLASAAGGELPLQELARSMVLGDTISRSGLTRLLDRMERSGLIRRRLNRHDRRRFDVSITARGRARFETVWPEHEEGIRSYFSDPLADRDIVNLRTALTKLIRANQDQTDG
jgi:DNA-binding MarR family transcriptional regulator